jgi:DNA invertase Pin-like site-specific DNA recombinase
MPLAICRIALEAGVAMKFAAYVRVSTDAQVDRGHGLDVQKKAITRWANANRHQVAVWTSDEGMSGAERVDRRVGLYEALEALRSGTVGGLVVFNHCPRPSRPAPCAVSARPR